MHLTQEIQKGLFEKLLAEQPADKNELILELADVMAISKDGVYRRWRGDTLLTLEDIRRLVNKYPISIDSLLFKNQSSFISQYDPHTDFSLENYLSHLKQLFLFHNTKEDIQLYFNAKELPILYLFHSPEILAFKHFFWQNTFRKNSPSLESFHFDNLSTTCRQLSQDVYNLYTGIESTELWSLEIFNATLKQILYYFDTEVITEADALKLFDAVHRLIDVLEQYAASGYKGKEPNRSKVSIYFNEVLIGNNTVTVQSKGELRTYLSENIMTTIMVDHQSFCEHTLSTFKNITKKSTVISGSSEKNRKIFFRQIRAEVDKYKVRVTASLVPKIG
jgi:hypothetical protein